MANIADCIDSAVQQGALQQGQGQAAKQHFQQLYERYATIMPDTQARILAAQDLKEATRRAARSRYHAVVHQLQSMRRISAHIGKSDRPDLALQSLIEFEEGSGYTGESVASLTRAYVTEINAGIREFMAKTGRNVFGRSRNQKLLENAVRELHAEDTGDAGAKAMAAAIRAQQERMRLEFNARGGDIGKLNDFGVSHTHDPLAMRKAGKDGWTAKIIDRLDWSRITDHSTGKPFSTTPDLPAAARPQAEIMLGQVYDNLTSMGWNNRAPALTVQGKALYNQRAEARLLHFKGGTEWLEYNAAFGTGDPYGAVVGGLHAMARDVALMRVLGPNPTAGLEFATQHAQKRAQQLRGRKVRNLAGIKVDIEGETNRAVTRTRAMLAHADGSAATPAEGYEATAAFFGAVRMFSVSTKLGSALLSSVSDLGTIGAAAKSVGMNSRNVIGRQVQLLRSHATRETAAQMGYVADTLATVGASASRYLGDTYAPELASRMADFTLRASGLNFWTDMGRTAFKMEFSGFMAANAGRAFDAIDAPLRDVLAARGITAADWDLLRDPATLFVAPNGAKFLSPHWWLEHQTTMPREQAEGLAMRLLQVIEEQQEFAIPTVRLRGRVAITGDARPGTFLGELSRSGAMYKNFALSLMFNQARRFWAQPTPLKRAAYAAKMLATLTALGAVAVQLKELAKGRDPRPMDDGKFWAAAVLQGGGVGIFGDFFAAGTNRFGGGFAQTLAGPVVGLGEDLVRPIASNAARAAQGKDILLGRDLANLVRYNTPVASSLWYQRLAFDRLVADQLQQLLDPEADLMFRRASRRAARDYGTDFWWERGAPAPDRAPNLANITGQ